ncbi:hypothetical protein PHISCL_05905 [Aspergillus sclerotialis]|uniref:Ketoreductase domain-containing protein n=1 Tax=Aspergillus sclerotialis TaxID=2070753 RepID=A0A3A2ZK35_9EURO|nr:hypothetical protein PHISCL_05905 [Aspergillus sclerotialis]
MTETTRFSNKVILITGAGSGIGRATSIKLANLGASLALSDINLASVTETAAQCSTRTGQSHSTHEVDVSNTAAVDTFIAAVLTTHGRIDHIFNCAGVNPRSVNVSDTTDSYWATLIGVNLQGTFNICRASIPHLRSGASILNMSSMAGIRPSAGMSVYAASKAGVIGLSKGLALELGPRGIRVNVVAPGDICTATNAAVVAGQEEISAGRIALGRLGSPEEVADTVVFLFEGQFVNGSVVEVHGGLQ